MKQATTSPTKVDLPDDSPGLPDSTLVTKSVTDSTAKKGDNGEGDEDEHSAHEE